MKIKGEYVIPLFFKEEHLDTIEGHWLRQSKYAFLYGQIHFKFLTGDEL